MRGVFNSAHSITVKSNMKHLSILALTIFCVACATDNDQPVYSPRSGPPPSDARPVAAALDMLPPADWWHQPQIADAVRLTADQIASLDKIANDQDDITRLDRDMMVAMRDVRSVLDSKQPSNDDIMTAAQRLRTLRDTLFDRQIQLLAAERAILSQDQWQTLQQQLQNRREQRRQDNGYPRRGGRGMGGRGRFPG
jgi:Spy/CpxP family protein refolding chaperone